MKLEELLSEEDLKQLREVKFKYTSTTVSVDIETVKHNSKIILSSYLKDKSPTGKDEASCLEAVTRDVPQEDHDKN